jgi:putative aldouronate transport system permease protein
MSPIAAPQKKDSGSKPKTLTLGYRVKKDLFKNYEVYVILLPVVIYYLVFAYKPMYGALIAFQNWRPGRPFFGPDTRWVGFEHFITFFKSHYFTRTIVNTLTISLTSLIFGFPAPIILALLLNELKSKLYAKSVQTILYLPHFIAMVVLCGMIRQFVSTTGVITLIASWFGFPVQNMLLNSELFVPIYVISGIWQGVGWGSIVYLAALTSIDQELYEAAKIDGAGKWRQTISITLPCLLPTIIILFILQTGSILSVGSEKVLLLYHEGIYDTADVISTYVHRRGLIEAQWSFSTAVGLFNSVVNFVMVISVNKISGKLSETSLW